MEMPFLKLLLTKSYRQFNYSALRLANSPNLLATIQEFTTQLLFRADTARLAPEA